LSGGEKKLLSFVRTLNANAALTLLDEPSEGVAPENIDRMATMIRDGCASGRSFVLAEQNLSFLMATMDRAIVLDHGEVVFGSAKCETSREDLERYLKV